MSRTDCTKAGVNRPAQRMCVREPVDHESENEHDAMYGFTASLTRILWHGVSGSEAERLLGGRIPLRSEGGHPYPFKQLR